MGNEHTETSRPKSYHKVLGVVWLHKIQAVIDQKQSFLLFSHKVLSDSLQPYGLEPSKCLCPWQFSRQEYWSGLSFPSPGDLPDLGTDPSFRETMNTNYTLQYLPMRVLIEGRGEGDDRG